MAGTLAAIREYISTLLLRNIEFRSQLFPVREDQGQNGEDRMFLRVYMFRSVVDGGRRTRNNRS